MKRCIPLEAAADDVCRQSVIPPLILQLPPEWDREKLEKAQDTSVYKYPADIGCDFANVFYKFDKTFSNNRIIAKQH